MLYEILSIIPPIYMSIIGDNQELMDTIHKLSEKITQINYEINILLFRSCKRMFK